MNFLEQNTPRGKRAAPRLACVKPNELKGTAQYLMTPGFHCFIMQELFTTPQGLNWHQLRWVAVSILLVLRCEALEDSPGDPMTKGEKMGRGERQAGKG